jgi:hypothetical protein
MALSLNGKSCEVTLERLRLFFGTAHIDENLAGQDILYLAPSDSIGVSATKWLWSHCSHSFQISYLVLSFLFRKIYDLKMDARVVLQALHSYVESAPDQQRSKTGRLSNLRSDLFRSNV